MAYFGLIVAAVVLVVVGAAMVWGCRLIFRTVSHMVDEPVTLQCPHCGGETPAFNRICRHCGEDL